MTTNQKVLEEKGINVVKYKESLKAYLEAEDKLNSLTALTKLLIGKEVAGSDEEKELIKKFVQDRLGSDTNIESFLKEVAVDLMPEPEMLVESEIGLSLVPEMQDKELRLAIKTTVDTTATEVEKIKTIVGKLATAAEVGEIKKG